MPIEKPYPVDPAIVALEASVNTLNTRTATIEATVNAIKNSPIYGGQTFVAAVDLGLRSLVRFNAAGQLILATDASADSGAIGVIDAPVAAGASTIVLGAGALLDNIGLGNNPSEGSKIFLGADGGYSLTDAGVPRLVQQVGLFVGGKYRFDFRYAGIWVAS